MHSPGSIAVDNSTGPSKGDVYVVVDSRVNSVLWKFSANGVKLQALKEEGIEAWNGALDGVAVDATGTVWVDRAVSEQKKPLTVEEGVVERFTGGTTNEFIGAAPAFLEGEVLESKGEAEAPFCPKPGFAVDAAGANLYIDHERVNIPAGACPEQRRIEEEEESKKVPPAEKPRPVVTSQFKALNAEELEALSAGLESQNTTAVAVDQASGASTPLGQAAKGDVYLANGATVAALDSSGEPIQHIELPGTTPRAGGVAIYATNTGALYVADSSNGRIDVFDPAASGEPIVHSVHCEGEQPSTACAQDLTPTSARLTARIDPNGSATTFYFQYGTTSCVEHESSCTDVPAPPGNPLSGFGDQTAEVELTGLQADTTYYYRVIVEFGGKRVTSGQTAETFFTTLPSAEGLLPDHRQWQMVSPPKKGGPLGLVNVEEPGAIQAAEDGSAIAYGAPDSGPSGEPEGNRSKQDTQFLFTRGESEWQTQDITTPHNKGEGFVTEEPPEYQLFSSDLSLGLVEPEAKLSFPLESPPLSPPLVGEQREKTIYLRDNPPISPASVEKGIAEEAAKNSGFLAPGYLPLITKENDTAGNPFGSSLELIQATPDLNHVIVESLVGLTKNAHGENFVGQGLYEWNSTSAGHALQLVSLLPEEEAPVHEARLGGLGVLRNAISANGSRIFFTGAFGSSKAAELFMRDTTTAKTIKVSGAEEGVSEPSKGELENEELNKVRFEAASPDGSKVYFKDTWPLTKDSTQHPTEASHHSDLYEFNVETKKLADLTIPEHPGTGEGADVLGTIPGAGEDGSRVYFVANGVLAPGATRGHCAEVAGEEEVPPGATCNLYVSQPDPEHAGSRETKLIATLSADDAPDWQAPGEPAETPKEGSLAFVTSRVSPNGRYLAFMSDRSLTGYDNEDATSKALGERLDQETYLFDAQLGRLVCASCNPNPGTHPSGIFVPEEGVGPLVDRSKLWGRRWLAGSIPGGIPNRQSLSIYEPRNLSDSGRLFFNSADALVPQDQNHKEDVYEYQPVGVGGCARPGGCLALVSSGVGERSDESVFLDASTGGGNVFFLTAERLLAQDVDSAFDIYDASVCGVGKPGRACPKSLRRRWPAPAKRCKVPVPRATAVLNLREPDFLRPRQRPSNGGSRRKSQSHRAEETADARAAARQGAEGVQEAQEEEEARGV